MRNSAWSKVCWVGEVEQREGKGWALMLAAAAAS